MRRSTFITALSALACGLPPVADAQIFGRRERTATDAAAWAIVDATTGFTLDSSNATRKLQIGSITKIATAMVVMDWAAAKGADLGEMALVPGTVAPLNSPNSIGLQPGDRITLRDALYAALMQSDNPSAETLAVHVGRKLIGNVSEVQASDYFVAQLNALARRLGMRDTQFLNAHGLDDLERRLPHSTAADVAKLANYALGHAGFTFYTSQKERQITWQTVTGDSTGYQLRNTNELLGIAGIDGVKTGTTRRAGQCVVISAAQRPESREVNGTHQITPRRLTVVVLNSPRRFDTARALLARGWTLMDQWAAAGRPMKGWRPAR